MMKAKRMTAILLAAIMLLCAASAAADPKKFSEPNVDIQKSYAIGSEFVISFDWVADANWTEMDFYQEDGTDVINFLWQDEPKMAPKAMASLNDAAGERPMPVGKYYLIVVLKGDGYEDAEFRYDFEVVNIDEKVLEPKYTVTDGKGEGSAVNLVYTSFTKNTRAEDFPVHSYQAQKLDNGYVRFTLSATPKAGYYICVFDQPDGELIKQYGKEKTDGSKMTIQFDLKADELQKVTKLGVSFFLNDENGCFHFTELHQTTETAPAKAATCTETGLTEGEKCVFCGKILKGQEPVAATGHTEAVNAGTEATCTAAGKTEGKHCPVCNTVLAAQQDIAALGHDWDDGVVTKEASYTENGVRTFTCKRCGETREEAIIMTKIPLGQTGWVSGNDGSWSYGDAAGDAVIGPATIGGTAYCFNEQGKMITGWAEVDGKWYYADASGELYRGWKEVGKIWYYFRSNGEMAVGWVNDGGTYYYMKPDGTMATGWVEDEGKWYYMDKDGAMKTGWIQDGKSWYLLKSSGEMAIGWAKSGGAWYYFKKSGAMAANEWIQDTDSSWYWFEYNGKMATGMKNIGGRKEMFDNNGVWQYTLK